MLKDSDISFQERKLDCELGVMAGWNTFSSRVISKDIFCHCVQFFMWILGICKLTFRLKCDLFIAVRKIKLKKKNIKSKFLAAEFLEIYLLLFPMKSSLT